MRTPQEILDHIEKLTPAGDFFGVIKSDLIEFLPFDQAKHFLKEEFQKEDHRAKWEKENPHPNRENVVAQMKNYIGFALEKAENHRGISASRSINHFEAWLWLLEDQELLDLIADDSNYPQYGAPILKAIGEKYDLTLPENGAKWFVNMSQGRLCGGDECHEGCGS